MTNSPRPSRSAIFHMNMSEFWSGDLGLTLVSVSLSVLIFLIFPLRKAGVVGHFFFDLIMVILMVSGTLVVERSRLVMVSVVGFVLTSATLLWLSRFYPTPLLLQLSSVFSIITMLLYVHIVLLVMFREGAVTWSRIQGGIAAYLFLGMAWAAAFQLIEELHAGSFHFVSTPADIDQLTSALVYFSFATLTTVGFGDITPLSPFARSFAVAEAIVGQLFPAILIGALVAMAMQSRAKS
jgi:Ion channel